MAFLDDSMPREWLQRPHLDSLPRDFHTWALCTPKATGLLWKTWTRFPKSSKRDTMWPKLPSNSGLSLTKQACTQEKQAPTRLLLIESGFMWEIQHKQVWRCIGLPIWESSGREPNLPNNSGEEATTTSTKRHEGAIGYGELMHMPCEEREGLAYSNAIRDTSSIVHGKAGQCYDGVPYGYAERHSPCKARRSDVWGVVCLN